MMKKKHYLLLILSIVLFSLLVLFANNWSKNQQFSNISIIGNSILSQDEIKLQINPKFLQSTSNLIELKDLLKSNPYIESLHINREGLTKLNIEIKEKKPIAIFIDSSGNSFFVDENSEILPWKSTFALLDIPIFRMAKCCKYSSNDIKGGVELLKLIKNRNNNLFYNLISELFCDPNNKTIIINTTLNGIKIVFGKIENVIEKTNNFLEFLNFFSMTNRSDLPKIVDLRWFNKIIIHENITQ